MPSSPASFTLAGCRALRQLQPAQALPGRWLAAVGRRTLDAGSRLRGTLGFVGDVVLALGRLAGGRSHLRRADLVWQIEQTGPRSVPIVGLVCGLVGLILAYMGAAQLQKFGAQSYIADLVSVSMVREIAALMTGVILSGRVGAAFAGQLATMQANDEIDALRVTGIDPVDHLVLPRLLALLLISPLLCALGALIGLGTGLLVAGTVSGVLPSDYIARSLQALTPSQVLVGLGKGTVYGALVALAGCSEGLRAGKSALAVGQATTGAVVKSIVWIVAAASLMTVLLQRLGW